MRCHSVLQMLLREQVSIRQLATILESLGDNATKSKDPILLTEYVRHRLARQLCTRYRDRDGQLHVLALDPTLEDRIRTGFEHSDRGLFIRLPPTAIESINRAIGAEAEKLATQGHSPVLLVSPQVRAAVKQLTETSLPQLVVMSFNEITRDTTLVTHGVVNE